VQLITVCCCETRRFIADVTKVILGATCGTPSLEVGATFLKIARLCETAYEITANLSTCQFDRWKCASCYAKRWARYLSRYSDWLRVGRSRDRIPVGARFSAPVQTGPGAHPASCTMGTGSFPGVKSGRGVLLTPHLLLVPWSRKSRAIPLLPLWDVQSVQSLSVLQGCTLPLLYLGKTTSRRPDDVHRMFRHETQKKLCFGYITRGLPYFLSSNRCAVLDISIQGAVFYHLRPARQSHTTSSVRHLFPDVCQRASNYKAALYFRKSSIASFVIARNILDLRVPFGARDFHTSLKQK